MGQWTNAGFEAKTLDFYKAEIQQVFIDAYGEDFLLDPQLPQGVLIQELAELFYAADMDGIEAFSRLNLNTATGVYLDLVGSMRGISRSQGQPQTANVALVINPNNFSSFTIQAGHIFTATNGDTFQLVETTTISSTQDQSLFIEYTENGDSTCIVGDKMTTEGYAQIQDIEIVALMGGTPTESDLDYRNRLISEYPVAGNTLQYVSNLILESPLVRATGFNYNDTSVPDGGLDPYCTEWMAVPKDGVDLELFKTVVATKILNNKMPGAPTDGNTTVQVEDIFGTTKTVKFTIPQSVSIQIVCTVATPEETGKLDLNNVPAIKDQIFDYVKTLSIGDNVSYSRCIAPVATDTGFDIVTFVIKKKATATATQTVGTSLDNISVAVTTFERQITTTGDYDFVFDGTDWKLEDMLVTPAIYGINYSGTPVSGDTITVAYTASDTSVSNGNYPIGPREYAVLARNDIMIEV